MTANVQYVEYEIFEILRYFVVPYIKVWKCVFLFNHVRCFVQERRLSSCLISPAEACVQTTLAWILSKTAHTVLHQLVTLEQRLSDFSLNSKIVSNAQQKPFFFTGALRLADMRTFPRRMHVCVMCVPAGMCVGFYTESAHGKGFSLE